MRGAISKSGVGSLAGRSSLSEKPVRHRPRILEAGINLTGVRKIHFVVAHFLHLDVTCLRESCMRENCTCSLSGGRRPARKRASSDPTWVAFVE